MNKSWKGEDNVDNKGSGDYGDAFEDEVGGDDDLGKRRLRMTVMTTGKTIMKKR